MVRLERVELSMECQLGPQPSLSTSFSMAALYASEYLNDNDLSS